ncbi:response regulator [Archangium violaceum]|uniref:response regulator n=1 Tax=Archangium violaceum TaxID=83451 RepID=UPI00193B77DF|nr:response regulator [Archangium violaceum]QRK11908.1 response regulator [Archangium violaceum]
MPSEPPSRQPQGDARPRSRATSTSIRVLFVADSPALRDAARRELSPGFELLPANTFALALPLLDVEPAPAAILIDLGLADAKGSADFLATLVERDYPGPRILLSNKFRPEEAATLSQASIIHFALASPWAAGELRAVVEAALGFRPFPGSLHAI